MIDVVNSQCRMLLRGWGVKREIPVNQVAAAEEPETKNQKPETTKF